MRPLNEWYLEEWAILGVGVMATVMLVGLIGYVVGKMGS